MKTLKYILEIYSDGSVVRYSGQDCFIVRRDDFDGLPSVKSINSIDTTQPNKDLFYNLVKALGFTQTVKYTTQRAKKLTARLKTFSEDDLYSAARAIMENDFLQGENPQGKRYGTIDYLLRNDEIVDNYRAQATETVDVTKMEILL